MNRHFNIRVYGLCIQNGKVLLDEGEHQGIRYLKFPGGGLINGESTRACLQREFMEEMDQEISVGEHFYTTDIFVRSAFDPEDQVICIYYAVKLKENSVPDGFYWKALKDLTSEEMTFPSDQKVVELLLEDLNS